MRSAPQASEIENGEWDVLKLFAKITRLWSTVHAVGFRYSEKEKKLMTENLD